MKKEYEFALETSCPTRFTSYFCAKELRMSILLILKQSPRIKTEMTLKTKPCQNPQNKIASKSKSMLNL